MSYLKNMCISGSHWNMHETVIVIFTLFDHRFMVEFILLVMHNGETHFCIT